MMSAKTKTKPAPKSAKGKPAPVRGGLFSGKAAVRFK